MCARAWLLKSNIELLNEGSVLKKSFCVTCDQINVCVFVCACVCHALLVDAERRRKK